MVEWASGHPGSQHYLIVLKASDEDQMSRHTESMFNEYISSAPAGENYAEGVKYKKMHYGWTTKSRAGGDEPSHQNF